MKFFVSLIIILNISSAYAIGTKTLFRAEFRERSARSTHWVYKGVYDHCPKNARCSAIGNVINKPEELNALKPDYIKKISDSEARINGKIDAISDQLSPLIENKVSDKMNSNEIKNLIRTIVKEEIQKALKQ